MDTAIVLFEQCVKRSLEVISSYSQNFIVLMASITIPSSQNEFSFMTQLSIRSYFRYLEILPKYFSLLGKSSNPMVLKVSISIWVARRSMSPMDSRARR